MIDYLDKDIPDRHKIQPEAWAMMPSPEKFTYLDARTKQAILEQARECTNDFSYAARNYFWITTKEKTDVLFSLWKGQELVLDTYYNLKYKGLPQKVYIIKARRLGCSTLIEGMIAWRAMFFPNTSAIVVSTTRKHSAYLFRIMLHIYDMMPWWLKPMLASRKEEEGLFFANPELELRRLDPGNNSEVMVQNSTQYFGIGEGVRLDACHLSELSAYDEDIADDIINGDLGHSLEDRPQVFGFIETTAKGAGTFSHRLWTVCERLQERSKWYPLFLPWFFETTRVLAPPQGWTLPKHETQLRERIATEWGRCDLEKCAQYRLLKYYPKEAECPECHSGAMQPVVLTDEQLFWHQDNREYAEAQGIMSAKLFAQEQASTAEESFQVTGYNLFNEACREWMNLTIRDPIKQGKIYKTGEIHGADRHNQGHCYVKDCNADHRREDVHFQVWEEPIPEQEYCIGVDVSEGIGEDYSSIFVNKVGKHGAPDEQVAVWRDNRTGPKELAFYCNVIGRWYNCGMMCIEYNTYQTTGDDVLYVYHYPNIFRWKHKDKANPMSQTWHWWTKVNTKAYLHQTAQDWLQSRVWVIRSSNFLHEVMVYKKDEADSRSFGAEQGFHDDELLSGMIALYCAHELDCDNTGRVLIPSKAEPTAAMGRWQMECESCHHLWGADNPENEYRCPNCNSVKLKGQRVSAPKVEGGVSWEKSMALMAHRDPAKPTEPPTDYY